jgi:hypothetical protein
MKWPESAPTGGIRPSTVFATLPCKLLFPGTVTPVPRRGAIKNPEGAIRQRCCIWGYTANHRFDAACQFSTTEIRGFSPAAASLNRNRLPFAAGE